MAALSITTSIVTSIVTVPGFGFTGDSIEGGHDLYQRARSLLDQIADSCDGACSIVCVSVVLFERIDA